MTQREVTNYLVSGLILLLGYGGMTDSEKK